MSESVLSKDWYIDQIYTYDLTYIENYLHNTDPSAEFQAIPFINSHYESWALNGNIPYSNSIATLIQPPEPFDYRDLFYKMSVSNYRILVEEPYNWNTTYTTYYKKVDYEFVKNTSPNWAPYTYYKTTEDRFPSPVHWLDEFDKNVPSSKFLLDFENPSYPYPFKTERIAGIDYDAIATPFKWQKNYTYCFPSHAIPKSFDYEGIHAPMIHADDYHDLPRPWYKHFNRPELLPDWRRLDPEFIGHPTLNVHITIPEYSGSLGTTTLNVLDRDKNRERYSEFIRHYYEESQS